MNPATATRQVSPPREEAACRVERHLDLVFRIARHLAARLPSSVELDDLVQAGTLGLIDAARNFQDDQGASFETYASIRIRGAMIDETRRGDWVPRSVHRKYRGLISATRAVEQRTGRAATAPQVAAELQVPLDDYHRILGESSRGQLVSLEALADEHEGEPRIAGRAAGTPLGAVERDAFRASLVKSIGTLPEREQLVLSLYYEQEMNLREIGAVLSVSESRVCQIHRQAMLRLRARLGDWDHGGLDDAS